MARKTACKLANGHGKTVPPPDCFVRIYFDQKGRRDTEAAAFLQSCYAGNWTTLRGKKIRDWKEAANEWIWRLQQQERLRRKRFGNFLKPGL